MAMEISNKKWKLEHIHEWTSVHEIYALVAIIYDQSFGAVHREWFTMNGVKYALLKITLRRAESVILPSP